MRIGKTVTPKSATPRARRLRGSATEAEAALWYHLRNRNLGGYKFRRQYPVGPYILDFICHEERLVIEVDGSQHLSAKSESKDQERSRFLAQLGLRVLRFDNRQVLLESNGVLSSILAALNPSTYPLPKERESEANPKRIRGFV